MRRIIMMKLKKFLAIVSISVITMMAIVGCGNNAGDETTSVSTDVTNEADETTGETIAAASISIDDKYLNWTEGDYNDASATEKVNAYSTYMFYVSEALGLSEGMTDDEVKTTIAESYTENQADADMEELFALGNGVAIKEAADIALVDFESEMQALLESSETEVE